MLDYIKYIIFAQIIVYAIIFILLIGHIVKRYKEKPADENELDKYKDY